MYHKSNDGGGGNDDDNDGNHIKNLPSRRPMINVLIGTGSYNQT